MNPDYISRSSNSAVAEAPVNETVQNIPAFFEKCGDYTYQQDFKGDNAASHAFKLKMQDLCGNAVVVTERNAIVRMALTF